MQSVGLILLSVALASSAQILLKVGMTTPGVQAAINGNSGLVSIVLAAATEPMVIAGLAAFGFSAVTWMAVLSKVDVSFAYPAMALGIVTTVLFGYFLLGEPVGFARMAGVLLIVIGVVTIAVSG